MGTLPSAPVPRRASRQTLWLVIAGAALSGLLYSLYTDHIWEDYFITFRHSENLVNGHGLRYQIGEPPVHGFTSPLGVLLPALCYWATGASSYVAALWAFRLVSIAAYVGGGVLFLKALTGGGPAPALAGSCFAALYVLDAKGVGFSCNGMETGFMLLFVGWAVYLWRVEEARAWRLRGLCWAGLMWTRPDGCVYIAVLAVAELLFARAPRRTLVRSLLKAAALCAVLYGPWVLWAWWYYGSPVPHTLIAKSHVHYKESVPRHVWIVSRQLFTPTNFQMGGWPEALGYLSAGLTLFCALYWAIAKADALARRASFCFFALAVYLMMIPGPAAWYLPPVTVFAFLVLAQVLGVLDAAGTDARRRLAVFLLLVLVGVSGCVMAGVLREIRWQQELIENRTRTQVGLWLKDHAVPGDRVYLEPLGYIGYFSQARMMDFPGLVCPENVALVAAGTDFFTIPAITRPEWVVLRAHEAVAMASTKPYFEKEYELEKVFNRLKDVEAHEPLLGNTYLRFDSCYYIFHRRVAAAN